MSACVFMCKYSNNMCDVCDDYRYAGGNPKDIPHPDTDWNGFIHYIKTQNSTIPNVYDCCTNKLLPWTRVDKLNEYYGNGQGTSTSCTVM